MKIGTLHLSRIFVLVSIWPLLEKRSLLFATAQECQILIPPSAINGAQTRREYVLGGHSWHVPVLDYLNDVVGSQFDPPITFRYAPFSSWLDAPTVKEALALGYDFISSNSYRSSCYESEAKTITLATERRVDRDPETGELSFNVTQFGAALYTLSNRTDIHAVQDVRGRKIGTNRYSNLAT